MQLASGSIEPGENQDLDAWRKVIGLRGQNGERGKSSAEEEKPSPLAKLKDKAKKLMMKVIPYIYIHIGTWHRNSSRTW